VLKALRRRAGLRPARAEQRSRFVIHTDVKSYHASICHVALMERLARFILDCGILNLLSQYIKRTSEHGGWFFDHERGAVPEAAWPLTDYQASG